MKRIIFKIVLIIITITITNVSQAQKNRSAVIEDVDEPYAWDIVYESFKKHNKKLFNYNEQTQTAISGFYRYTSLLVDNRAKYQVTYINGVIEVSFVERQYLSNSGWVNNLLPLSKKTQKKYIYPIATTIRELLSEKKKYVEQVSENNALDIVYQPSAKTIKVDGKKIWTDTGIDVVKDQQISLTASGLVYANNSVNCGPQGIVTRPDWDVYCVVKGKPVAGLIMKIGNGRPFFVGNSYTYSASDNGRIFLGVNDTDVRNNKGEFTVILSIISPIGTTEIIENVPEANQQSTKSVKKQKSHCGVYDNFAIIKTDNPEMQLLAIHQDGSMIGFKLTEDKKRVISVIFKKDLNSTDFVMFFDDEGNPKGAGFGDYVYVFQKVDGDRYKSLTFDKVGNCINESKIELAPSSEINQIIEPDEIRKGPNPGNIVISVISFKELNDWVQGSSEILNVVSCAIALPTGLGAIGPCGTLIISEILRVLPENHIYYNELVLAKELLSFITFSTPTGFIKNSYAIFGAMAASSDKINTLIEKYFPTPVGPKPFIETTEQEYYRKNGVATATLKYSKFITNKNRTIAIYKINTDKSFSFYDEYTVLNIHGEVKFDIPFNGAYEARVLYDNELKNKVQFSVVGDNVASNTKYSNYMCIDIQFAGSIHKDFFKNNEKWATMIHHFSIEPECCTDSRINLYGLLKPLEIEWSGNTFYATLTKKSGVSTVIYSINGKISNDGNNLEHIYLKSVSTHTVDFMGIHLTKEIKEVTLENIPFNQRQGQFTIYRSPEKLKDIKFQATHLDYKEPKNNTSSNNIEKDGYKMAREGSFIFHLKFFKSWKSQ